MGHIVFLTNMERQYVMMERARRELIDIKGFKNIGKTVFLGDFPWGREWEEEFKKSDIVIFTWMGCGLDTDFLKKAADFLSINKVTHVMFILAPGTENLQYNITLKDREMMQKYLSYGGLENYKNLWLWLANRFCKEDCSYKLPQPMLWHGIFHPKADKVFTDISEYRRLFCLPDRPTVGVLFYRDEWINGELEYQSALVKEIERQGMNALAVFTAGVKNPELSTPGLTETIETFFYEEGKLAADVLVNTIKFSLIATGSTNLETLKKLDIPILQAYTLYYSREQWKNSIEGMGALEVAVSVTLPEFDGVIHSVPVAGRDLLPEGNSAYLPIEERIKMVARKAKKWADLRRKPNCEKKIAVIFHNYPTTNSNIGSAAGLDSIESVRVLLDEMAKRGYKIDWIPKDSQLLIDEITKHATNDRNYITEEQIKGAERLKSEEYEELFSNLPEKNKRQLTKDWGTPPGEVFYYDGDLIVPGTLNGSVFITMQPPRGFGEDPSKIYHSPDCSPTHHYLGFYHWIRDIWKADAVIHVGTHGTLEWLPGKGTALSEKCYPDIALKDLPNIYPYWITVIGEGLQAKRRGASCLIGHISPPMSSAGTYDELSELEKLLDEYLHYRQNQPENVEVMKKLITEKAQKANLQNDISFIPEEDFDGYVQRLHAYITDIKNMQIRTGLHVLGRVPEKEELIEYLIAMTNVDNGDIPSLRQTIAEAYGFNYYDLLEQSAKILNDKGKTYKDTLEDVQAQGRQFIEILAQYDFNLEKAEAIYQIPWVKETKEDIKDSLLKIARFICETLVANLRRTRQEIDNLLKALEGFYVEPGPAGAPTSGATDALPTGRNFYGIDPRMLPTPAAWEIGKKMGDDVIRRYLEEEGRYPESVGIVIWATSNERSHGQCIAEFLYLLGVKPVWQKGTYRVIDLEVIPLEKLKRPRIDVTARISGLFRDSMPVCINLMDKAVNIVANLDEDVNMNYVKKHILEDVKNMEKEGIPKDEAWVKASYRIFGDPPGSYGAGVSDLLEAKNWENIHDLAKVYVRWGAHAYGKNAKGEYLPELFSQRLKSLNVTIQNEDNREISMLNSDDYNAYHGGMVAAVRSLKGKAPRSFCGDSSDRKKVVVRSLQEEIKRLFRGEAINPKFIQGMKKHGYKGALDLANYVAHSFQWDATSDVMEDWMYQKYAEKYALDKETQKWMREVNPWALKRIVETLLEASQRGLWNADEKIEKELQDLYLSIDGELEEKSGGQS